MAKLSEVKIRLAPAELIEVQRTAAASGLSTSALCRQRITSPTCASLTPDTYRKAVEGAAKTVSGLPRTHLEALVSSVITALHQAA